LLTTEVELRDGFGAVGFSILAAIEQGIDATPVVRLGARLAADVLRDLTDVGGFRRSL
jgi:hypothetical protein